MSVDIDALMDEFDAQLENAQTTTKVRGRTVTRKGGRTARTVQEEAVQLAVSAEPVKVQRKVTLGQDADGNDITSVRKGEESGQKAAARLLTAALGYLCDHNGQPVQSSPSAETAPENIQPTTEPIPTIQPTPQPTPAAPHVNGTTQKGAARKGNGQTAQVPANAN